ncbi:hypothetical protein PRIPAC_76026, partial [Pristionchus pacificus]
SAPFESEFLFVPENAENKMSSSAQAPTPPFVTKLLDLTEHKPSQNTNPPSEDVTVQSRKPPEAMDYKPNNPEHKNNTQVVNRHRVQPVQILVPSGNSDRFEVNERELQSVLGDPEIQDRKVVIISVAGAFRKG